MPERWPEGICKTSCLKMPLLKMKILHHSNRNGKVYLKNTSGMKISQRTTNHSRRVRMTGEFETIKVHLKDHNEAAALLGNHDKTLNHRGRTECIRGRGNDHRLRRRGNASCRPNSTICCTASAVINISERISYSH